MSKLKLNKKEKASVFDFLWENLFDSDQDDEWYLQEPMVKLVEYLGAKVPQDIVITSTPDNTSISSKYTIRILKDFEDK